MLDAVRRAQSQLTEAVQNLEARVDLLADSTAVSGNEDSLTGTVIPQEKTLEHDESSPPASQKSGFTSRIILT